MTEVPGKLIDVIRSGECIAFVGAGFTGAARLPSWSELLSDLAARPGVNTAQREHVARLVKLSTAHAFDEAAQTIEDALGREAFIAELDARLRRPALTDTMAERLRWLQGIPFRAIVTTNFDGVLTGATPSAEAYRSVLRPEGVRPWWKRLFHTDPRADVPVVKIHGDVGHPSTVVISRKDYRRLLYDSPGYQGFLRAVLANRPVLYLGFSFMDAYLNEIRSEVLALLGYGGGTPVAHAIINDVPGLTCDHYLSHEGIHILTYDTRGRTDFSGFDGLLREIHDRTNPAFHLGSLLAGKRILWLDPNPDNNTHVTRLLAIAGELAAAKAESFEIELVSDAEEALGALAGAVESKRPFDLTISHWGHSRGRSPTVVRLLEGMRSEDLRCPVILFSTREHADERKPVALGLGAQAYCFTNGALLKAIVGVLSPGRETG